MNNTIFCFSAFSGKYYEMLREDVRLLEDGHLPLNKKPDNNCKKCYGRGHKGLNSQNFTYELCSCVHKRIDFDILKEINNVKTQSNQ
jgi:hypothetical protein